MGDITNCLYSYLLDGKTIEGILQTKDYFKFVESVQLRIDISKAALQLALLADPKVKGTIDDKIFLETIHTIFGELLYDERPIDALFVVKNAFPNFPRSEILRSINCLVKHNLLSYVKDEATVVLHSRKLKYTYLQLKKDALSIEM